jgi:hypothetical protein
MSDDEALNDLAVRTRQLEAHLLRSPEYLLRISRKVKWLVLGLLMAVILFFFEIIDFEKTHVMSLGLLGMIGGTDAFAIADCAVLIRTKQCLRRLNERWIHPDAKTTLESLRQQQADMRSRGSAPSGTRSFGGA